MKKKGSVVIEWVSKLKKGDQIAWESESFVAQQRQLFYERLKRRDPDLKEWLEKHEKRGNFNEAFHACYEKLADTAPDGVDVLEEIVKGMRVQRANARHRATLLTWMSSEESPWLPLVQSDLGALARTLRSLARKYGVAGVSEQIERLKRMSKDRALRDLVARIRGRDRRIGRSIETGSTEGAGKKGGSKRGRGFKIQTPDVITEARWKAQLDYEGWLARLPAETKFEWATMKASPNVSHETRQGKHSGSSLSAHWYRSFRNGPVVAKGKGQLSKFRHLLGLTRKQKRRKVALQPESETEEIRAPKEPERPSQEPASESGTSSGLVPSTVLPEGTSVQSPPTEEAISSIPVVQLTPETVPSLTEWRLLGFGTIELYVKSTSSYEWVPPTSASFLVLDTSKVMEGDGTRQVLEILPLNRPVNIPESYLELEGSKHLVPPATFEFKDEAPNMGLDEVRGISKEVRLAAESTLLAGLELRKRKPAGSITFSIRALELVRSLSPQSIGAAAWKGIDTVKSALSSTPRKLEPNLVVAEWLFRTAHTGIKAIQASDVATQLTKI